MRRRLVSYFERRDRPDPDALADETFNRIGRTLEEEGVIQTRPPAKYCYVIARFVLLENFRHEKKHVHLQELKVVDPSSSARGFGLDEAAVVRERRLDCLDRCLQELKPEQRKLVVDYYRDVRREKIDRRRAMAGRLGISMNALGIRVCRIRDALLACIERRGETGAPRRVQGQGSYVRG